MATSGTYNFNLDIANIIEDAFERCGLEARTGYDLEKARRALDLLLQEWANHQVNLWTLEGPVTQALVDSAPSFTLSHPIIDVLDAACRDSDNNDVPMWRISLEEYLDRPDKDTEGRPTHYAVQRGENDLTVYVWPEPEDGTYTFVYWEINMIEDVGSDYTNNVEVPRRFLPALTAGLAYKIAQRTPSRKEYDEQTGRYVDVGGVDARLRQELKADYEQLFMEAREEDRDRASLWLVPMARHP